MKIVLQSVMLFCSLSILQGCACHFSYYFDGGRNYKESNLRYRYSAIPVDTVGLELDVLSDDSGIIISRTYYSPWSNIDSLSTEKKVVIIEKKLTFPDGSILKKESRPFAISAICYDNSGKEIPCLTYYYTCDDFKKKVRKYKNLSLKIVYDMDSLGVITHYEKEFELVRKKHCRVAVH